MPFIIAITVWRTLTE